jgi:hypothetical protein
VNPDGSRALVGGTQTGALKAYRVRTVPEPSGGGGGSISGIAYTGGKVVITYTGTLSSADTVSGTFAPVTAGELTLFGNSGRGAKILPRQLIDRSIRQQHSERPNFGSASFFIFLRAPRRII